MAARRAGERVRTHHRALGAAAPGAWRHGRAGRARGRGRCRSGGGQRERAARRCAHTRLKRHARPGACHCRRPGRPAAAPSCGWLASGWSRPRTSPGLRRRRRPGHRHPAAAEHARRLSATARRRASSRSRRLRPHRRRHVAGGGQHFLDETVPLLERLRAMTRRACTRDRELLAELGDRRTELAGNRRQLRLVPRPRPGGRVPSSAVRRRPGPARPPPPVRCRRAPVRCRRWPAAQRHRGGALDPCSTRSTPCSTRSPVLGPVETVIGGVLPTRRPTPPHPAAVPPLPTLSLRPCCRRAPAARPRAPRTPACSASSVPDIALRSSRAGVREPRRQRASSLTDERGSASDPSRGEADLDLSAPRSGSQKAQRVRRRRSPLHQEE